MRLSLSWIIILFLLAYIVFFFLYGCKVYESFTEKTAVEGFQGQQSDISMTTCPPSSDPDEATPMKAQVPPGTTQTWCHDIDGSKKCSLSVSPSDPTSCSHYYLALLQSKATTRCPASMPNYFQNLKFDKNVDTSIRGCTAGARTPDGKSPADKKKYCTIYTSQKDDMEKLDSCTNVKRLETAQCFSSGVRGVTAELKANKYGSPNVQCTFSQIEQVQKGTKTVNLNAAAEAAERKKIEEETAQQSKWAAARNLVATLATKGPVSVNAPEKGKGVVKVTIFKWGNQDKENINLSQLVVRDVNGKNIAGKGTITTYSASGGTSEDYGTSIRTLVDGTEAPRPYPRIYHSKNTGNDGVILTFNSPVDISSITIYNRSDCCSARITKYGISLELSNSSTVYVDPQNLKADQVQTISFIPPLATVSGPTVKANLVTENIFSPESVTHTCTEIQSYRSWIDSIRVLYPEMYASSKYNLESSETWSDDKKNTFCHILEQTKINKTMTASALKAVSVL